MEAAVRWSPFSSGGRERFLLVDVLDQSISLNEISDRKSRHLHLPFRPVAKVIMATYIYRTLLTCPPSFHAFPILALSTGPKSVSMS